MKDGSIVVGLGKFGDRRAFIIDKEVKTYYEVDFKDKLKSNLFISHEDVKGRVWFISDSGFGYLSEDRKEVAYTYEYDNWELGAQVYAINSDSNGKLWLATDKGIVKFDVENQSFVRYTVERGLQGNAFSWFINSGFP